MRFADRVGVSVVNVVVPEDVMQKDLILAIESLNSDEGVHGVLLFRPLPDHIDEDVVRNALDPRKDVDGITDLSLAVVFTGEGTGFAPCTAQACIEILDYYGIELMGRRAVVVGRSLVIGKPVAMKLLDRHATVTIAHSKTKDLAEVVRTAQIVIACVGRARMLDRSYLSEGQVVVDVGVNVCEDGSLVGDVDMAGAKDLVAAITPVPGGVGTVTTSTLIKHVVEAAQRCAPAAQRCGL
jgi:methylenetetrahydrofolate dehydrogenase (NADP+)/methenyltetrahydrofolate cyclohydrolase